MREEEKFTQLQCNKACSQQKVEIENLKHQLLGKAGTFNVVPKEANNFTTEIKMLRTDLEHLQDKYEKREQVIILQSEKFQNLKLKYDLLKEELKSAKQKENLITANSNSV